MLSESQVRDFHRDGFLRGGRVLSDAQVDALRAELDRVIENRGRPGKQPVLLHNFGSEQAPVWQIVNIYTVSALFRDLVFNERIGEEVAQLANTDELRIWHDQIQYKPPSDGGFNHWHQDSPYWPILTPMDMVTAWVALDDVDESNGCMSMVPGSHHWGDAIDFLHSDAVRADFFRLPPSYQGHPVEARLCPVGKGEIHFHHSMTWHGSHNNASVRPRRAIALHYMTAQTRYRADGEHCMKQFVKVGDGAILRGDNFPVTWAARQARTAQFH